MRLCLAKYSDFLNFRKVDLSGRWGPVHRLKEERNHISWEVNSPELTEELTTSVINELKDEKLPDWAINNVVYWKTHNRRWSYTIEFSEPTGKPFGKVNLYLSRMTAPGELNGDSPFGCFALQSTWLPVRTRMRLQAVVHFGDKFIFFNTISRKCVNLYTNFQTVPNDGIKQLRQVPHDQIRVTLYVLLLDNIDSTQPFFANRTRAADSDNSNWRFFLEEDRTDVTIVCKDGQIVDCHYDYVSGNSHMFSKWNLGPTPFTRRSVFHMLDLSKAQVLAFLRYQYCGLTDMILESIDTSLVILKVAERYQIWRMWNDIIAAVFEEDYDWFEEEATSDMAKFLGKCVKREEKATQHLLRKLWVALEQPIQGVESRQQPGQEAVDEGRSEPEAGAVVGNEKMGDERQTGSKQDSRDAGEPVRNPDLMSAEGADSSILSGESEEDQKFALKQPERLSMPQDQALDPLTQALETENHGDSMLVGGKRCKLAENERPQLPAVASAPAPGMLNVRRSARLQVKTKKPVQRRGVRSKDETWQQALRVDAERKKNASKAGHPVYGPRDIWKDPVLPKVAIIPDTEVKVEKVEPMDEEEYSTGVTSVEIDDQFIEEQAVVVVKEEELILMDESSETDHYSVEDEVSKLETD